MTESSLHWQIMTGAWQFTGNGAQQTAPVGYAAAHAHIPLDDFAFSVRITPTAGEEPQAGIIFRSDASGANRYSCRARQHGLFLLEKLVNGGRTEIAGRLHVPVDDSLTLTVIVTGWRLRCFVDGRKVYDVTDPVPLSGQHIGLLTLNTTARFEDIHMDHRRGRSGAQMAAGRQGGLAPGKRGGTDTILRPFAVEDKLKI